MLPLPHAEVGEAVGSQAELHYESALSKNLFLPFRSFWIIKGLVMSFHPDPGCGVGWVWQHGASKENSTCHYIISPKKWKLRVSNPQPILEENKPKRKRTQEKEHIQ